jgi:hypothetical protein
MRHVNEITLTDIQFLGGGRGGEGGAPYEPRPGAGGGDMGGGPAREGPGDEIDDLPF